MFRQARPAVVTTGILGIVVMIQLTIVNGLPLPGGGTPDLLLLGVICVGVLGGPRPGLAAGFWSGLALDLAPPALAAPGLYTLVLCLAGYAAGQLRRSAGTSAAPAFAVLIVVASAAEVAVAGLSLVLDPVRVGLGVLAPVLLSSVLYDLACIPLAWFVVGLVARALRRGTSQQSRIRQTAPAAQRRTARKARHQRDRLADALTGAAAHSGDGWISTRSQVGSPVNPRHATGPAGPAIPRIAFSSAQPPTQPGGGRTAASRRTPRIAFGQGLPGSSPARRTAATPRFVAHPGVSASGAWLAGPRLAAAAQARPSNARRAQPTFAGSSSARVTRPVRAQKVALMRAGRGPSRLLPWTRGPGGRSDVWRIGSRRMGALH